MTNKFKTGVFCFIACVAAAMPFSRLDAQKYDNVIDKTVVLIGNSMIMLSQVESEAIMMQFNGYVSDRDLRCEVLENMMVSKLFYTQAMLDSLAVNPDMVNASVEDRMNNIMTRLGGEKQMEEYFGKSVHKLRQEWTKLFTEQNLVQEMQRNVADKIPDVTPREVERFYKRTPEDSLPIVPTQYKISQIAMYPNVEKAKLAARERLLELRERILDGEKFSFLATMYSEDPGSAMRGGELGMSSKSIFWPAFSDAAMALKPGQISSIVETPDGFHLIQLIDKQGDMFNARHILIKPRYTAEDRDSAFAKLDSLKNVILADSIKFELAARIYSQDQKSRTNGGLVSDQYTGSSYFEVDQMKPADYNAVKDLKPGEISEPLESVDDEGRGNTIYKIIRLEEIRPSHVATYEKDFNVLVDVAQSQKTFDAMENFIKEKQATTYIVIDPLFQKCAFQREGWVK